MNTIPKVHRFGERYTNGVLDDLVVIQEKYDGSQFSFTVTGDDKLICNSKTTTASDMFKPAISIVKDLKACGRLVPGNEYHCEFLAKPKHNVLTYERVPSGYLILFDIRAGEVYQSPSVVRVVARILGLEPAQTIYEGYLPATTNDFSEYLAKPSSLGGRMEGIVIKNYFKPHGERPNHPMTAKIVSEQFKERQACRPQKVKAEPGELVQPIVNALRTEARWLKAVQHVRDAGKLTNSTKDIGPLIAELQADTMLEEEHWIKEKLFQQFRKDLARGVCDGFAQWYIKILANGGFSVWQESQIKNQNEQAHQ